MALTVNFGVPPLLFVQVLYGHLFYSSSVMLAVPWILVIPILILAYYGAYIFVKKADKAPVWSKGALVFTSLFLLYIAFVFVNNNTLAIQPDRWGIYFENPGGWNLNLGEPTLWPRYLHFVLGGPGHWSTGKSHLLTVTPKWMRGKTKLQIKAQPEDIRMDHHHPAGSGNLVLAYHAGGSLEDLYGRIPVCHHPDGESAGSVPC